MRLTRLPFHRTLSKSCDVRPPDAPSRSEALFCPADVGGALDIVARAAMLKTCATGVAVALMERGRLLCRARVGDIAPDLGVALNVNSGITGACVRSAQLLNCYDAQTDKRVDAVVCRVLGIRSILVIPMLVDGRVVGILEALSVNAHAFEPEHVQWLKRLADFTRDLCYGTNANAGPGLVQKPRGQPNPVLASNNGDDARLRSVNGAVQPYIDNERQEHDPGLATFRGVLEKIPPTSTWEDICQALVSRLEK
jgi:putative methionine-R-sulfoxide reductase with GAF domain